MDRKSAIPINGIVFAVILAVASMFFLPYRSINVDIDTISGTHEVTIEGRITYYVFKGGFFKGTVTIDGRKFNKLDFGFKKEGTPSIFYYTGSVIVTYGLIFDYNDDWSYVKIAVFDENGEWNGETGKNITIGERE